MTDRDERLEERIAALERTVTDGHAADGLPDAARMESRLDDLEATASELDGRLAELDAAVQALRGFAGGVRAVDEAVERRADAAVARVDRLEADLQAVRAELCDGSGSVTNAAAVGDDRDGNHATPQHGAQDTPARTERADRGGQTTTTARSDASGRRDGHVDSSRRGTDHEHDCSNSPSGDEPDRHPSRSASEGPGSEDGGGEVRQSAVAARTDAALAEAAAMADDAEPVDTDDGHTLAERLRRLL
ncbi:MAG: hypothetical protein ABEH58_08605 [Haloplanus sp.]